MKKQALNPFLPLDTYIPDGEPHVFGDRVYLFGSHDKEAGETYCMLDYMGWSAPIEDLSDWSCSGIIYSPKQDPLYSTNKAYLYAPDVVRGNDGRYYLYYCMGGFAGKGGYDGPIGVAVCNTPDGRYEYLGHVRNPDGSDFLENALFDPAVINDNGRIRLYYGASMILDAPRLPLSKAVYEKAVARVFSKTLEEVRTAPGILGANTVELQDDMLTVRGHAKRVLPGDSRGTCFSGHGFFEGASIRKIDNTYYLIYSSQNNHELCYATSRFPDRNFVFGGTIVSNGDIFFNGRKAKDRLNATGTNHGSIEKIGEKWYVLYHRLTHSSDYSRQACAEEIQILPNGSIHQVEITSCGLNGGSLKPSGTYPAVICCNLTNGHMPQNGNRVNGKKLPCVSSEKGERFVRNVTNGTWVGYKYFEFQGETSLHLTYRGSGTLSIHSAMNGKALDTKKLPQSEVWTTASFRIPIHRGKSALYFHCTGKGSLDLLKFSLGDEYESNSTAY